MPCRRHITRAHRSRVATLHTITKIVAKNDGLSDLVNFHFDPEKASPVDSEDASLLKSVDLDE